MLKFSVLLVTAVKCHFQFCTFPFLRYHKLIHHEKNIIHHCIDFSMEYFNNRSKNLENYDSYLRKAYTNLDLRTDGTYVNEKTDWL